MKFSAKHRLWAPWWWFMQTETWWSKCCNFKRF